MEEMTLNLMNQLLAAERRLAQVQMELVAANLVKPDPAYTPLRFIGDVNPLLSAFAKAHGEFEKVLKKAKGMLTATATFNYADMATLFEATSESLAEQGVTIIQPLVKVDGTSRIVTIMAGHGARIEADVDIPPCKDVKEFGAQVTYLRRYAFQNMCSLAGEKDADSTEPARQERPQSAPSSTASRQDRSQLQERAQQRPQEASKPADATTPAATKQESLPAASAEPQSAPVSSLAGPKVDLPSGGAVTESRTLPTGDALGVAIKKYRKALWASDPEATAEWIGWATEIIKMPLRDMKEDDAHKLLLRLEARAAEQGVVP